jgi:stage II sporulation protein AA (anti-sigma F factor antagonist)
MDRQIGAELPKRLTIDMGKVSFMDSSGIAVLLRARRRMEELEGGLVIQNVPEQADRVFTAAGLHRLLRFE